jgi:acid phosphatase
MRLPNPPRLHTASVALALLALALPRVARSGPESRPVVPPLDRVVVVIMENKSYEVARVQPFTSALIKRGVTCTSSYAVTHPSQPNYMALWSADLLGVLDNTCPAPGAPLEGENLGHACEAAGIEWRAYSEELPAAGSDTCSYEGNGSTGLYTRKHEPWTNFGNLDHTRERPYTDLATDLVAGKLPRLVYVIPSNCHNSHNSKVTGCDARAADAWLQQALPPLIEAAGPRGLVILTWDEDDKGSGNHILTVFAGGAVRAGAVVSRRITHYTVVRTITDGLGLKPFGLAAQETAIDGIWTTAIATR